MARYTEYIEQIANELGDTKPIFKAQGGHSKVYFGNKYVYKITEEKVLEKSRRINEIILSAENIGVSKYIPKTIVSKSLSDSSLIVEELKLGNHPSKLDEEIIREIVDVLNKVHKIRIKQVITNFEDDNIPASEYWDNQVECADEYIKKVLRLTNIIDKDNELLEECLEVVKEISSKNLDTPNLVLVYKDVHTHNTLINPDGTLNALIDWDAAMSGPIELEYAVLWSRYREVIEPILDRLGLDQNLFISSGIVQGLRFWKSFTRDSKYVDQQRRSLKSLIEMYKKSQK